MSDEKETGYEIDIFQVFKREIDNLRKGDLSGFSNEETESILNCIYTIISKSYHTLLNEIDDIKNEVYCRLMSNSKGFQNLDTEKNFKSYIYSMINTSILLILRDQNSNRNKANSDVYRLDLDEIIDEDNETSKLDMIESNLRQPMEELEYQTGKEYYNLFVKKAEKYPCFKMRYIDGLSLSKISEIVNKPSGAVQLQVIREKALIKMEMAEEGFFDNPRENIPLDIVVKIRESVSKYGITATCMADYIPFIDEPAYDEWVIEQIRNVLNIPRSGNDSIKAKIAEDRSKISKRLKEEKCLDLYGRILYLRLYLYLFKEQAKNFDSIPSGQLHYVYDYIKNNDFLKCYYYYPEQNITSKRFFEKLNLTEDEKEDIAIEEVTKLKANLQKYIRNHKEEENSLEK